MVGSIGQTILIIIKSQNNFFKFGKMEKISEEERKMRIDFIKNLIRDNKMDLTRLEAELQELLDLDPLKQKNIRFFCFV